MSQNFVKKKKKKGKISFQPKCKHILQLPTCNSLQICIFIPFFFVFLIQKRGREEEKKNKSYNCSLAADALPFPRGTGHAQQSSVGRRSTSSMNLQDRPWANHAQGPKRRQVVPGGTVCSIPHQSQPLSQLLSSRCLPHRCRFFTPELPSETARPGTQRVFC